MPERLSRNAEARADFNRKRRAELVDRMAAAYMLQSALMQAGKIGAGWQCP
jgi:RNase H-fold protein (predicted Holliday junction resolvase)